MASSKTVPEFFRINDSPIYFQEDWDTGIGGGLWSTGLAMAKYFKSHSTAVRFYLKQLIRKNSTGEENLTQPKISAIELGSGNSFLSVCLASLARDLINDLVITDLDDHLALMNEIVNANTHILSSQDPLSYISDDSTTKNRNTSSSMDDLVNVIVMEHRWGEFTNDEVNSNVDSYPTKRTLAKQIQNGTKKFDFIFGSDIAYREYGYLPLIASFQQFFHKNTVALVGITMLDTRPKFFHLLGEAGFKYDRLADHLMAPEFRNSTFGLFVIQKKIH